MAIDIRHLLDGSLQAMVADTSGQLPALNARLNEAVVVRASDRNADGNLCLSAWGGEMKVIFTEISVVVRNLRPSIQITAFIDMGFEVEIVALQKATPRTPRRHGRNNLAARTRWLQDEPTGKVETTPPSQSDLARHSS